MTDAVIPEQYLAKRGDRPRSLPPQVTAEASDATDSGRFFWTENSAALGVTGFLVSLKRGQPVTSLFSSLKLGTAYDVTVFQSEAKTSPDVIVSGQVGFWGESETNATHDDVTVSVLV